MDKTSYSFRCEQDLLLALKKKASEDGQSVSQTIQSLLRIALELDDKGLDERIDDAIRRYLADGRINEAIQQQFPVVIEEILSRRPVKKSSSSTL